jgi:hypothetical protein
MGAISTDERLRTYMNSPAWYTRTSRAGKEGQSEKLDLNPPRGTRDFYPEDMRFR